jgi:predicted DsbA family dithiol-disulfide isomerase
MHEHLMRHRAAIDRAAVLADAGAVGVDLDRVRRELEEPSLVARVEHDVERGSESGVHSTPTFFFNGALYDGHYDFDALSACLNRARQAG